MSAVLPPLFLTAVTPFVFTVDRYALVALPGTLIFAAIFINEGLNKRDRYARATALGLSATILLSSLGEDILYFTYQNGQRPKWKDAFSLVEAKKDPSDAIYASRKEVGDVCMDSGVRPITDLSFASITDADHASWFVVCESMTGLDPNLKSWLIGKASLVESLDVSIPGKVFDMRVYQHVPDPQP